MLYFDDYLLRICAQIGTALEQILSTQPLDGERQRPARLIEAMRYACLNGGKRLRPFLVVETARLFAPITDATLRAACALELIHCYSLIHDDLPAMDDDDLRRGLPTVHKAFDEATAILAGDGLLTLAFDVAADPLTHADSAIRSELVLLLARASGIGGMVGGQALDLAAEQSRTPLSRPHIEDLQAMKTGALLRASVEAGALIGGADKDARRALTRYGTLLGAAFQIADDLLDAEGDEARVGKRIGKDHDRNKATLVAHLGIAGARAHCNELVNDALTALAPFGSSAHILRDTALFVANRHH
jgi:farnesyl diphosphate synthase